MSRFERAMAVWTLGRALTRPGARVSSIGIAVTQRNLTLTVVGSEWMTAERLLR